MANPPTAVGFRGSLSETPLPQVLRRIFLDGLKGTLSLVHGDETRHLFFVIWAMTQTYADFDVQVAAVLGRRRLAPGDYQAATALITRLVLRGAGLQG